MKLLILAMPLLSMCFFSLAGADEKVNVISYYAVTNSLDGQPMIETKNVLRFFPVFAMRKSIETVTVTIYSGGRIYTRQADSLDGKRYWEAMLPEFKLGEAIQRIEVEVCFQLSESYRKRLGNLKRFRIAIDDMRDEHEEIAARQEKQLSAVKQRLALEGFGELGQRALRRAFERDKQNYEIVRDSLLELLLEFPIQKDSTAQIDFIMNVLKLPALAENKAFLASMKSKVEARSFDKVRIDNLVKEYANAGAGLVEGRKSYLADLVDEQSRYAQSMDSLKSQLAREIEAGLADTAYSGPSVRKSDVVIQDDLSHAKILYRNYKTALRKMTALDPAERMGIFRLRYVPFPIVGTAARPGMILQRPFSSGSPTVFEIGLAFGDAIVPGDELLMSELSWRRIGVAFAVTENLFTAKAEILALALTYDFNSYGSIGLGGNFAGERVHGYASLGINKKAFEALVSQLSKVFK